MRTERVGLVAAGLLASLAVAVRAEPTYRYTTQDGREGFTNVRSLVPQDVAEEDIDLLRLPELSRLDFGAATEAELKRINERLERTHAVLTDSAPCHGALREASMPWYQRVYAKEPHWVWLAGLFVAMAVIGKVLSGWLPGGTWVRTMLFILPLLLAVGLVGTAANRMSETLRAVRHEAEVCGSELEPASPDDRDALRRRAGIVGEVQRVLRARARRIDRETERIRRLQR